jgi:hypothetical protein
MGEQPTLEEFVESSEEQPSTDEISKPSNQTLFRFTGDQFVNEAIADLARQLTNHESISVDVRQDKIQIPDDQPIDPVLEFIEGIIEAALSETHVRTAAAREINSALVEQGSSQQDERWIPPADRFFPGNSDSPLTIYPDDTVDSEALSEVGIEPDGVSSVEESERGLYALNPEFVGNSSPRNFPKQVDRFRRYYDVFAATLQNEHIPDEATCMTCGRTSMPAYKDVEGDKLEYNQTFTILASASGRATSLGYSARDTAHQGRCAACLVAGFYYSLMEKFIRPTGTNENDVRVFCPVGNFEELVGIRTDFQSLSDRHNIDPPTTDEYQGRQTIGQLWTNSHGMQVIEFYEHILRHINSVVTDKGMFERELKHRPTALTTYISEVGRTRTIRAIESIDPDSWAYDAVRQRSITADGDQDDYWPVADVLGWFANLDVSDDNKHLIVQDDLAFGILERSLARIERAMFEVTKLLDRSDASAQYVPHPGYRADYFQHIMTQSTTVPDRIDDEAINSIRKVATALGRVFHGQDDIGVLIKLQNASSPTTFLQAFEKAAMQAQKRSHDEPPGRFETSRDDDVSRVLKLIGDRETFEPTKRMFVIHTSLAAQYENVRQQEDGSSRSTDSAATASSE